MTVLSLAVALGALTVAENGGDAVRVAVVDVPAASEQYLRTKDLEAHFETVRRQHQEQREVLRQKHERLARSLQEELKPGTDEFRARAKQLALLEAEMQWFAEAEMQKRDQSLAASLRSIFDDIQTAIREVATERGFDLVLAADPMPDDTPRSATEVRQRILLQKVLYWNPRVDLTGDVVPRLNARYKARGPATPQASTLDPSDGEVFARRELRENGAVEREPASATSEAAPQAASK